MSHLQFDHYLIIHLWRNTVGIILENNMAIKKSPFEDPNIDRGIPKHSD